jgi:hypothetical protein
LANEPVSEPIILIVLVILVAAKEGIQRDLLFDVVPRRLTKTAVPEYPFFALEQL